jgi:hypothetical protein
MQSDDLYRFIALRAVDSTSWDRARDPLIDAYGPSATRATLLPEVVTQIQAGAVQSLKATARAHLDALPFDANDPWQAPRGALLRRLAQTLPPLVRDRHREAALKLVVQLLDTDIEELPTANANLLDTRAALADLLLAQALSNRANQPMDTTGQMLLVVETIERLASTALLDVWWVPLAAGNIVLPLELRPAQPRVANGMRALLEEDDAASLASPAKVMGDLVLLRQQVRGYSLGEIAHVENVLIGETFDRSFRTLRRTEQRFTESEDTEKEAERDLQTTTRDEFRSEIAKANSDELALAANFDVQASYNGGTYSVVVGAGASASYRRASEEREATAFSHAREVVDKTRDRITSRVQSVRESMTSYEQEDSAKHSFQNKEGPEHIVGVYRWLEKRIDMHLVNYGRRLIYEFTVPEPSTFWKRLVVERGNGAAGEPPAFPQMPSANGQATDLTIEDFALRAGQQMAVAPERWADLVNLAGQWGVQLEAPPAISQQAHFAFALPGSEADDSTKPITRFGSANDKDGAWYYESPRVNSSLEKERLKVPDGYLAGTGSMSLKGWMSVRNKPNGIKQYERGYAVLLLNGRRFGGQQGTGGGNDLGADGSEWTLNEQLLLQGGLAGEVGVSITTNLNGISGSIRLDCTRTRAAEDAWAQKMYGLFATAFQARMDAYRDAQSRAGLENTSWAGSLPAEKCREIERRELQRGVLSQLTQNHLEALGNAVLAEPAASSARPPAPVAQLGTLEDYAHIVTFFEQVFDWLNMSYVFSPYVYGRRSEWARLAVADDADAQFKAFLSAGSVRVQIPVRRGHEAHAEYFFGGLGVVPLDQRIPWLSAMRSIAEDLAAGARAGFDIGPGTLSVERDSDVGEGNGTLFNDPQDLHREIRLAGRLYIIRNVESPTRIRLSAPYQGTTESELEYEIGGIVIGPKIEVSVPTTLVAIDTRNLTLPEFAPRYVQG